MTADTDVLISRLFTLRRRRLPPAVAARTVVILLNALAAGIDGGGRAELDGIVQVHEKVGGAARVPVLGRAERLDTLAAALVNGTALRLAHLDDVHVPTSSNAAATCAAVALAVTALHPTSGRSFLNAFCLGVETQLRLASALYGQVHPAWELGGICGPIGGAVTAGILLGLTDREVAQAVGLAASQTLGLRVADGTGLMPAFISGKAALNGVLAAHLCKSGFTAPQKAMEHPRGYLPVLAPNADVDFASMGKRWEIDAVFVSRLPIHAALQPVFDAARKLRAKVVDLSDVERLDIELSQPSQAGDGAVTTRASDLRRNPAHVAALGLAPGEVDGTDDPGRTTLVKRLRPRTRLLPASGSPGAWARVTLVRQDGPTLRAEADLASSPERALVATDLGGKVADLLEAEHPDGKSLLTAVVDLDAAATTHHLTESVSAHRRRR